MKHPKHINNAGILTATLAATAMALTACGGNKPAAVELPAPVIASEIQPIKYPELPQCVYDTFYYAVFADFKNPDQINRRSNAFSKAGFAEVVKPDGQINTNLFYASGKISNFGFREGQQVAKSRLINIDLDTVDNNIKLPVNLEVTPQDGIYFRGGSIFLSIGDEFVGAYYEEWDPKIKYQYNIEMLGDTYAVSGDGVTAGSFDARNFNKLYEQTKFAVEKEIKDEYGNNTGVRVPLKSYEIELLGNQLEMFRATVDFFTLDVEKSIFEQFESAQTQN